MPSEAVVAEGVAPSDGPFVRARLARGTRFLMISGQGGRAADGKIVQGGVAEQTRQTLKNIDALLRAAGATKEDVVMLRIYLTNVEDRDVVAQVRSEYFGSHAPASTLVGASALAFPEFVVEIEAIAIF